MSKKDLVESLIQNGECQTIEFKDFDILSNPFKLAKTISSIANGRGGSLLIGVRNDGSLSSNKYNERHRRTIYNTISDRIQPIIHVEFNHVQMNSDSEIYHLEIPSRKDLLHSVVDSNGIRWFIRLGDQTKEIKFEELHLYQQQDSVEVNIPIRDRLESNSMKTWKRLFSPLINRFGFESLTLLLVIEFLLMIIPMMKTFNFYWLGMNMNLDFIESEYFVISVVIMFIGVFSFERSANIIEHIKSTKCKNCNEYFSYRPISQNVISKRNTNYGEEWTVRNKYECISCGFKEEKIEYEKHED